jgi:ubiquinone/menaquinone biosynthesis C-methylase UbiE
MNDVRAVWRSASFDRLGAAVYDFIVERERLARLLGRLAWGGDVRRLYASMRTIGEMADGSSILDVPCGGGVAFRALRPEQRVRYVAADISPGMLRRARRVAERRGLRQIEFLEVDVESLPFEGGTFDLCVCFNSLHCFDDPEPSLKEIARCLRPAGRLVGDAAVRGAGARFDRLIDLYRRAGVFGPGATVADLERWLVSSGLRHVSLEQSGAIAYFVATR